MINNFIATIGVEVHCALNTKSKMFSSSKNCHYDLPNINLSPIDLGMPGVLPTVNEQAVVKAIRLAYALNMQIDLNLRFDRKNYYYQDLPKGYQITQQFFPIGKEGTMQLSNSIAHIERIHLEEDTAKEQTIDSHIFLDYNRAGVPLIEIVSKPDFHSASAVTEYLVNLKRILTFLDISDGKMEDGSMRVDVNVSVALIGQKEYGKRIEIKNLNSISAIAKAINYEIDRQSELILLDKEIIEGTYRWNEQTSKTEFMRPKEKSVQYRYFTEPNIINIPLTDDFKRNIISEIPKTPFDIKQELYEKNVQTNIIELLLDNVDLYKIYDDVNLKINNHNLALTWIVIELVSYLKSKNKGLSSVDKKDIENIVSMLELIKKEELNGKQAKLIFPIMLETKQEPYTIMKEKNLVQIKDEKVLKEMLLDIVNQNLNMLEQYDNRTERVLKFYLGLLMKNTHGQANPNIANEILINIIKEKLNK